MPKLQETTGFSSSKLPLLKEASQAGPFLEQQVITGGSVSQSLVSQWPWDGSVSQQAAAPLFSKQAQSSQLWSVLVQLCAEWYASPPSRAYYLRSGLILILFFIFFFSPGMNKLGLKRRQNSLEGSQMHYLIAIIMLSCLVSFHVLVTRLSMADWRMDFKY